MVSIKETNIFVIVTSRIFLLIRGVAEA